MANEAALDDTHVCRQPCAFCAVAKGTDVPEQFLIAAAIQRPPPISVANQKVIDRIVAGLRGLDLSTLTALAFVVDGYDQKPVSAPFRPYLISSRDRLPEAS